MPEYAGKRVRYALVVVDLLNRELVEIIRSEYSFLPFDAEGRIDPAECEKEARLAFEIEGCTELRTIFIDYVYKNSYI